jgi:DNA primase
VNATYTEAQIEQVLRDIGVRVVSETFNDFTCLCPFHANSSTPAMSVSKYSGLYLCFSPECGATGSLDWLVRQTSKRNEFEAARFIAARGLSTRKPLVEEVESALSKAEDQEPFSDELLSRLRDQFLQASPGPEYMKSRGFSEETCADFEIGYSGKQNMVTVPVHTVKGVPMGFVGRSVEGKDFKNSSGLQKSRTLFNGHRAKAEGGTAIVTEASFDVMSLHQAGFPQGVALLGGSFSPVQAELLNRYFEKVIIFTDFDDKSRHVKVNCRRCLPKVCEGHNPGRELGIKIQDSLPGKQILWACYEPGVTVYPHGAKDATDLTDEEIRQCIRNAMSKFEYMLWDPR